MSADVSRVDMVESKGFDKARSNNWHIFRAISIRRPMHDARNEVTRMDEKEPEEIEQRREQMRKDD